MEAVRAFVAGRTPAPIPQSLADFDAAVERGARAADFLNKAALEALNPQVTAIALGGVPTLEVLPKDYQDDGSRLVYIHGGGFVQGSAQSYLLTAALAAASSGRRVTSIDYTLAPRGTWKSILEEVVSVWIDLIRIHPARSLGLIGDSAGGCIAAAVSLLLRDRGLAQPAALALLSPATDFSREGDTNATLEAVDYLDPRMREVTRNAYAPGADLRDPLVSPVHGDFTRGFPPVLLQVGTRELLLSDSVRLHRSLRAASQVSRLEVYEGMPHGFQGLLADTPEGQAAWGEIAEFWREHLSS
jgi:epsilon-lactone hydrolase